MNLVEIFQVFPTEDHCLSFLEQVRWKDEPRCPYCESPKISPMPKEKRHHCNSCNASFSVTVGTIFHNTKLPLQKWFLAICLILNAKKGLSARQLSRDLKVNKDTAWRISMKIREALLEPEQKAILRGIVEVDETYRWEAPQEASQRQQASAWALHIKNTCTWHGKACRQDQGPRNSQGPVAYMQSSSLNTQEC